MSTKMRTWTSRRRAGEPRKPPPAIIAAAMLCLAQSLALAQQINVTASVDKNVVTLRDRLQYTITISGAQDAGQPRLPDMPDFRLLFGPQTSMQTSIINNRMSVSRGYTYLLSPRKTGTLNIGAATLKYRGKTYRTRPIQIQVVKNEARKGGSGLEKRIFVEVSTDKREAYIYEQIVLSFKFFYDRRLQIAGNSIRYTPPETKGFLTKSLGEQRQYQKARDGIIYNVIEVRTALFPVAAGTPTIGEASLSCDLKIRSNRRRRRDPFFDDDFFNSFFGGGYERHPVTMSSKPVSLTINPLPEEGKPANFTGTVGSFTFQATADPTKVKVGNPITLSMKIVGEGYIETIGEPCIPKSEDFRVYPPETKQEIIDSGEQIRGYKTFDVILEPQNAKLTEIPEITFAFFDPKLKQYRVLKQGPFPISVEESEQEKPIVITPLVTQDGKEEVIVTRDAGFIHPIKKNMTGLTHQGRMLYRNPMLLAALPLPIVVLIISLLFQQHREKLQTDVSYARSRQAKKMARKRLTEARRLRSGAPQPQFYAALSRALSQYLGDKLDAPPASIAVDSASEVLARENLPQEIVGEVKECFELCDQGRFSSTTRPQDEIDKALRAAEDIIKKLEKHLA